ncbi:MAG: hypothetical protein J6M17_02215 [Ruminococcus sp.]|nr:hypothetical protein [Ruminococcus sp.]
MFDLSFTKILMRAGFLTIVLAVTLVVCTVKGKSVMNNYRENGVAVTCTTTGVNTVGNNQMIIGQYTDDSGKTYTAEVTRNGKSYLGEEFTGYVLAESPEKVYCMPSADMNSTLTMATAGAFGIGILLLAVGIARNRKGY